MRPGWLITPPGRSLPQRLVGEPGASGGWLVAESDRSEKASLPQVHHQEIHVGRNGLRPS